MPSPEPGGQALRRREFIAGGIAAAWPLLARAQDPVRRIGLLMGGGGANDPDSKERHTAFLRGLQQLGWIEGRNVQFDVRWPLGDANNIRRGAAELVALAPDVLLAAGTSVVAPLLQATRTVPIVFAGVSDPVGAGFVDSLARPGGNVTGFMQFEYSLSAKWLELLKQIAPGVKRVAVIRDPVITSGIGQFAVIQSAAPPLWNRCQSDQRTHCRRDRARDRYICALPKWGISRDSERGSDNASRTNYHAGGAA